MSPSNTSSRPRRMAWYEAIRRAFTDNLFYKGVALVSALSLWAWVQSEQVVQERVRVRLDWALPEGFVTVEPPLSSVTATVEGVQAYTRGVHQQDLAMKVDLSAAREGEVNLDLSERPVDGLPPQVRVLSLAPQSLQVKLDRLLRRRLPVRVATKGEPATGYLVKSVTVDPERVEVSGPASVVRGLVEVLTDELDVSALKEDAEFQVGLDLRKGQLAATRGGDLTVSVHVVAMVKERRFAGVPVLIRDDGRYVPRVPSVAVTLRGPADRVDAINPDEVSLLVSVPADGDGKELAATAGRGGGARYEVVQPGGDTVEVSGVEPEVIPLDKR